MASLQVVVCAQISELMVRDTVNAVDQVAEGVSEDGDVVE